MGKSLARRCSDIFGFGWASKPVPANYTPMQLTQESARIRRIGLLAAWIALGVLIFWHTVEFRNYIRLLDGLSLRGAATASTPLKRVCPTMYADAQMWVRHALALADGSGPQLRYTYVDNAPFGREVHWDSGFAWLIVGAGELRHWVTGEPFPTAVEQSMAWINFPLLLAFIVGFSTWVARRAGLGAGVLFGFAMLANPDFFGGFGPNYVDHHGLIAAGVLGLFLGGIFMGVGFWRKPGGPARLLPASRESARAAAVTSAAWGVFGMWISAASLIPAIAIMGIAAGLAILLFGRRAAKHGVVLDPDLWRWWGAVGGIGCLAMYLLEYAPGHLGFRMEVNHPAYALGWWGASEIIAQMAEWRRDGKWPVVRRWRLVVAIGATLVAPTIIAIGGEKVFVVFDPFVSRLSAHVAEGISFAKQAQLFGLGRVWQEVPWLSATLILLVVLVWRSHRADRPIVLFTVLIFVVSLAMALRQVRWWASASGPELCLLLLGVIELARSRRRWLPWACVAVGTVLLAIPPAGRAMQQASLNRRRIVDNNDVYQPFYRDVAAALRASQPKGDIVLLSSPNSSVAIGYYGEFKTIGTLYWENLAGTKAAAEMFSAQSDDEARRLLRARGVTHVAMISHENFLAEYFNLLHPDGTQEQLNHSFGVQLLVKHQAPLWLEPIPYTYPTDLPKKVETVLLFKTKFYSPQAEAAYDAAMADFGANRKKEGEAKLDQALALAPDATEFWTVKAHVRLVENDAPGALAAITKAIDHASPLQQAALCQREAKRFYDAHAYAGAVRLYERSLQYQFDPTMANNAVWLMATCRDDSVRNGPAALQLAQRIVAQQQAEPYLTGYAAALAECGRFADAIAVQTKSLSIAQAGKDPTAIRSAEARLAAYRDGRPWRE
ncbi:MAG TPA: hypothetical protein VHE61_15310 [Opitutaceae bacterium]|nr:hypothetical protein [Opitutaceae bacterium]